MKTFNAGGRKITRTTKTLLERSGVVQLVRLERVDCAKEIYGVTFPQKIGTVDGGPICEQFLSEAEARLAYDRYVRFFSKSYAEKPAEGEKMAHICDICGELCYCDIEDMESEEVPDDCTHVCTDEDDCDDMDESSAPEPQKGGR